MQGGIFNQSGLFITLKILDSAFNLRSSALSNIFERLISQYGLCLGGANINDGSCGITDVHTMSINKFDAIVKDSDGMVKGIHVASNQSVDLTGYADGTWKLLAQIKAVYLEEGTITLTNGSNNIVGTDTAFTEKLNGKMNLVILNSVEGNNGVYEIESITNDTTGVLKDTFTGTTESGLIFSAGGVFPDPNIYPSTTSGYRCYEMEDYEFVITQGAAASNQIYLCDVVISGGFIMGVTDKRTAFKLIPHAHQQVDITDFMVKAGQILGSGANKAVDDLTITVNAEGQLQVKNSGVNVDAEDIITGLLALARGGTHTDLNATGGTGQVLKQKTTGGDIAVEVLTTADIPALSASKITSDQLALARGGTHKDMSATGGAGQFLKQKTAGGDITVEAMASADIPDGAVTPAKLSYKEYTALLSQTGTNAPTATVTDPTLGTITFGYDDIGEFTIFSSGLFTQNKTLFFIANTNGYVASGNKIAWVDINTLSLKSIGNNVLANGVLSNTPILIRVYP